MGTGKVRSTSARATSTGSSGLGVGQVQHLVAGLFQGGDLLLGGQRAVADVIDAAGEGVDDGQAARLPAGSSLIPYAKFLACDQAIRSHSRYASLSSTYRPVP